MKVTFTCIICGTEKTKQWSASMPGKPTFCSWACKSEHQRRAKPVTKEWLVQKYETECLDTTQIGKLVNRDPKSVWNWLKDFGIPTRKRGHASKHQFAPGAPSLFKGRKHTEEFKAKARATALAQGRVPYDPAVGSYMKGRRGAETPMWKGGVTPERQSLYSSKEWAECIESVWARDDSTCQRCGKSTARRSRAFHIHHIIPFEYRPGRTELANLVLLCTKCHGYVHSAKNEAGDFIKPAPKAPASDVDDTDSE